MPEDEVGLQPTCKLAVRCSPECSPLMVAAYAALLLRRRACCAGAAHLRPGRVLCLQVAAALPAEEARVGAGLRERQGTHNHRSEVCMHGMDPWGYAPRPQAIAPCRCTPQHMLLLLRCYIPPALPQRTCSAPPLGPGSITLYGFRLSRPCTCAVALQCLLCLGCA